MNRGQSLLEVIFAVAIFAMIAGVLISTAAGGSLGLMSGGDYARADALAGEALEVVRGMRDGAWNAIPMPTPEIIDGRYTRDVTITDIDIHTKKITARVGWDIRPGVATSIERETYLTNWDSKTWRQTDWSGGAGQTTWSDAMRFDSASDIEYSKTPGEISLVNTTGPGAINSIGVPTPSRQLNEIDMISSNEAWIVGNARKVLRCVFNFSLDICTWTQFSPNVVPTSVDFRAVDMMDSNNGWIAGTAGRIVRYSGGSWSAQIVGSRSWNGISMVSTTDGWAVGDSGTIARYNNTIWQIQASPVSDNLNAVDMISATDGWAVGANGKIIRYNGSSWVEYTDTGNNTFYDVFMLDVNNGWAVGNSGLIYKWNGSVWSLMVDTGGQTWNGVAALAPNDIWVVGSNGWVAYWGGGPSWIVWQQVGQHLRAVDVFKNTDTSVLGFAVGSNNTVLRIKRAPTYATSGELISSAFDMGDASPVQVLEWDENNPCASSIPPCKVRIQISRENDSGAINWRGPSGDSSTYFEGGLPILIPASFNGFRWLRYKVRLEGPGSNTPYLQEIKIHFK